MKKERSIKTAGLVLLVAGLAIGAGLTFTLSYAYGVLTPRTLTTTETVDKIVVITVPSVVSTTSGSAVVAANATSCQSSGGNEFCEVSLVNSGTAGTATTGNCSLTFGGHTYVGYTGPTRSSAVPPGAAQQLIAGGSADVYCQASAGGAAGSGTEVTGNIALTDGVAATFSKTASS